ncbi:MAG: N-acetyltransferase [Chloroflexales bacterium]|nr:N-acetyltransferase [Chloroflexales bacterium]
MAALIRLATEHDANQIRAIYAPIVTQTNFSFELTPPTVSELRQRINKTLERMPWLSCELDGVVAGYAYATPHRVRVAYQWSVEVSVYVHEQHRQRGVARALYTSLFDLLRLQGYYNAFAGITLPNESGARLHQSFGFQPVGVYRAVAYKRGAWHDAEWYQLKLQEHSSTPAVPAVITRLADTPALAAALGAGSALLR